MLSHLKTNFVEEVQENVENVTTRLKDWKVAVVKIVGLLTRVCTLLQYLRHSILQGVAVDQFVVRTKASVRYGLEPSDLPEFADR